LPENKRPRCRNRVTICKQKGQVIFLPSCASDATPATADASDDDSSMTARKKRPLHQDIIDSCSSSSSDSIPDEDDKDDHDCDADEANHNNSLSSYKEQPSSDSDSERDSSHVVVIAGAANNNGDMVGDGSSTPPHAVFAPENHHRSAEGKAVAMNSESGCHEYKLY
jgi:hypothetical protein